MVDYETEACIVCLKASKGYIATGNVRRRSGEEVLATFCSDRCYRKAPNPDDRGTFGRWTRQMGRVEYRAATPR